MALAAGAHLGPYEVVGLIGTGGMGEVYKARDTRLDRTVALKVLVPGTAIDTEQRRRFRLEARAASALNHPHICTLHDVGSEGGVDFLVLEYLDGQTLAQRLTKGPVPVAQAIEYATQIADALDRAHREGIVHRDLKPANVMLTKAGAKLLDLGLAKLKTPAAGLADLSSSLATRASPITTQGTILGTLAYMSPEQVQGRPVDARSDVFSFGAVPYEMLTGQAAFPGSNAASVIAAILDREPPQADAVVPGVPPALGMILKACLEKDPEDRVQSAHDLLLDLRRLRDTSSQALVVPRVSRRYWRRLLVPALAFLAGAAATWTLAALTRGARVAPRRVVRFGIEVPASRDLGTIALSPDGSRLAYVGIESGTATLFVRAFHESEDQPVRGTEGASFPFFSPDGAWLGFFSRGQLRKVPVAGGQVVSVCDVKPATDSELGATATWAEDDTIVFSSGATALSRVSAAGGSPTLLTTIDAGGGELGHTWPFLLPGGMRVLYTAVTGVAVDQFHVNALSLREREIRPVAPVGTAPTYLATGHVLYVKGGQLLAIRFDATRMQPLGTAILAVDGIGTVGRPGTGSERHTQPQYAVSRAGDLAYVSPLPPPPVLVIRVDRAGGRTPVLELPPGFRGSVSLSPDGRRLAMYRGEANAFTLWTLDLERGIPTRVIGRGNPHALLWSPDGERLAFSMDQAGTSNLFVQAADGSGTAELLVTSPRHGDPGSWSRDGRWMAYAEASSDTNWDLWALDVATRETRPFRRTPASEQQPAISRDGHWIAYASNEAGEFQVYVEAFPSGSRRIQVSPDGGTEPQWTPDGQGLIYRSRQRLMTVRVNAGPALSVGKPVELLDAPFLSAATYGPPAYAIAPDGRTFYFLQLKPEPPAPTRINVVLGWLDEFVRGKAAS
jgi:Tol biopolymer transport system component